MYFEPAKPNTRNTSETGSRPRLRRERERVDVAKRVLRLKKIAKKVERRGLKKADGQERASRAQVSGINLELIDRSIDTSNRTNGRRSKGRPVCLVDIFPAVFTLGFDG